MKRNPEYRPITTATNPTNQENQFTKVSRISTNFDTSTFVPPAGNCPASSGLPIYPTTEHGGKLSAGLLLHVCPNANTGINRNTKTNKTKTFFIIPSSRNSTIGF